MWTAVLLITFLICLLFWKILWAISKPIFVFIYEGIVNVLMDTGMSKQAAKALISLVGIILILVMIF